jgi:PadR family transcriptional regulator PadR
MLRIPEYHGVVARRAPNGSLGEVAALVLTALAGGERHGYALLAEIRELSGGHVRLGTGTLYGALERLADAGLVDCAREELVDGRQRRYYRLTGSGRAALTAEIERSEQRNVVARLRLAGG